MGHTCTGNLSILLASLRANGSLILSNSLGRKGGNPSTDPPPLHNHLPPTARIAIPPLSLYHQPASSLLLKIYRTWQLAAISRWHIIPTPFPLDKKCPSCFCFWERAVLQWDPLISWDRRSGGED